MTKEEQQVLIDFIRTILGGSVGALIVMLVANKVRVATDFRIKRKRFKSYLDGLRQRVAARGHTDFLFSPENREIPKLEAEVLEVRHCIVKRRLTRFDDAIAAYKAVGFDTWAGADQERREARDAKNEKAHQTLISSLGELYECAR